MNLDTFARHGVFTHRGMTTLLAARLRDPAAIRRARAFPYPLLAAYRSSAADVPSAITEALQDAMEISISNVPVIEGKVYVLVCFNSANTRSNRLRYFLSRSASFTLVRSAREFANRSRPASESERALMHTASASSS